MRVIQGMFTACNEGSRAALPEAEGLKIISDLTHREMVQLLEQTAHQSEFFDDKNMIEISDPSTPGYHYCLCRNPRIAARETAARQALDGCYVIKTTVSAAAMDKDQVVSRYKSLTRVEQAFRNMKTVSLEMRPIHHKTDSRIRARVFLCMLAYYLQWHFNERLVPLFARQAQAIASKELHPKDRTLTLASVIETLKSQRRNEVSVGGASFQQLTEPTPEARSILDLLACKPPATP